MKKPIIIMTAILFMVGCKKDKPGTRRADLLWQFGTTITECYVAGAQTERGRLGAFRPEDCDCYCKPDAPCPEREQFPWCVDKEDGGSR